jgi:hypothetical protein
VVVTGDISNGKHLSTHLRELADACKPRPVYFVCGNHDYFGSSFERVRQDLGIICAKLSNLHHLGHGEIIPLGDHEALIGHGGWADGRAGHGSASRVHNPDFYGIEDFRGMGTDACFQKMKKLGRESGEYFRMILPYALTCYRHIWIATHVPPFTQAVLWNGKQSSYKFQPHYTNVSVGYVLWQMSKAFPRSTMTVLSGHTHSQVSLYLRPNLHVHTAGVTPGYPKYEIHSVRWGQIKG